MTRREERIVEDQVELSASSTPYFTILLWALFALKVYQFYQYIIGVAILFVIYQAIKYLLIKIYHLFNRQPRAQKFWNEMTDFYEAR